MLTASILAISCASDSLSRFAILPVLYRSRMKRSLAPICRKPVSCCLRDYVISCDHQVEEVARKRTGASSRMKILQYLHQYCFFEIQYLSFSFVLAPLSCRPD